MSVDTRITPALWCTCRHSEQMAAALAWQRLVLADHPHDTWLHAIVTARVALEDGEGTDGERWRWSPVVMEAERLVGVTAAQALAQERQLQLTTP